MLGTLYLVATPIGNMGDLSPRAKEVLASADLIAAEDTRNSIKLLNHFEIKTKMTSYHEFNKVEKARYLVDKMLEGLNVAVITDAGTPGISDPGEELVRQCYEAGITVTSVPGACAAVNALIISGRPTRRFAFEAFLPADKKERKEILETLEQETRTVILYEAPHRLLKTLNELHEVLGNRKISLCKELTKRYENVFNTTIKDAVSYYEENEPRGEFVLVIEGKTFAEIKKESQEEYLSITILEHMEKYLSQGMDKKQAMKQVAKDRGISKRDVYQALLAEEE